MSLIKYLLFCSCLAAQVVYIPPVIYPGSRLAIATISFSLSGRDLSTNAPPRNQLIVTAQGRDFLLPLIQEPFPPAEEINPKPSTTPTYLVPRDLPLGRGTLRYGDLAREINVHAASEGGIYTLGQFGMAYAHQQTGNGPVRRNRFTDPARPGDRVTLWGTAVSRATVFVGGTEIPATVSQQTDGLDRVEFTLPESIGADCSELIFVNRNPAVIATAEHGAAACTHHLGITPADLMRLDRGQTIPVAAFYFFSAQDINVQFGEFSVMMLPLSASLLRYFTPAIGLGPEFPATGCTVIAVPAIERGGTSTVGFSAGSSGFPGNRPPPDQVYSAELLAPDGSKFTSKSYSYGLFPFNTSSDDLTWKPGNWTFRNLEPSTETITVTARRPFRWKTAPDFANFSRDRDFILEWDPTLGNPGDSVTFVHSQFSEKIVNDIYGHQLLCSVPMSAGKIVVPSSLMRSIQWIPSSYPSETWAGHSYKPSIYRAPDGRYVQIAY